MVQVCGTPKIFFRGKMLLTSKSYFILTKLGGIPERKRKIIVKVTICFILINMCSSLTLPMIAMCFTTNYTFIFLLTMSHHAGCDSLYAFHSFIAKENYISTENIYSKP